MDNMAIVAVVSVASGIFAGIATAITQRCKGVTKLRFGLQDQLQMQCDGDGWTDVPFMVSKEEKERRAIEKELSDRQHKRWDTEVRRKTDPSRTCKCLTCGHVFTAVEQIKRLDTADLVCKDQMACMLRTMANQADGQGGHYSISSASLHNIADRVEARLSQ